MINFNLEKEVLDSLIFWKSLVQQNEAELAGTPCYVRTKSRTVVHDEKYIYLFLNSSKTRDLTIEYMDYSDEFYRFLTRKDICSFSLNSKGRMMVSIHRKDHAKPYYVVSLSRICYLYFNESIALNDLVENYHSIARRVFEHIYDVDHVCNDTHNHCRWNLSKILRTQNGRGGKSDLVAHIKPPYICIPVIDSDGHYRIQFGHIAPQLAPPTLKISKLNFLCKNTDSFIDFLQHVTKLKNVPESLKRFGAPLDVYKKRPKALYFTGEFENTSRAAETLLALEEKDFIIWPSPYL